jgi:hypothetical protein
MPDETVRIPAVEIPGGVLGHFSVYDPKTDSQLLMTASRGDAPNHLNFVTTALTRGALVDYFTLEVKGGLVTCLLEAANDPEADLLRSIGKSDVSIEFRADGRAFSARLIPDPRSPDNLVIYVLRHDDPTIPVRMTFVIKGGDPAWLAVPAVLALLLAVKAAGEYLKCLVATSDADIQVGKNKQCKGDIEVHKK